MVKLTQLLKFIGAMTLLSSGCSTQKGIIRNSPYEHITGTNFSSLDQSKALYQLEVPVIYNKGYYLNKIERHITDSLDFLLYPEMETLQVYDIDSGETLLDPQKIYLPMKVIGKGTANNFWDYVLLRSSGDYTIKADIKIIDEIIQKNKLAKNNSGYKIIKTEEDSAFALKTIIIQGREFFFPLVEESKINDSNSLPFYLIPVEHAKIEINPQCGNIKIINIDNIYRPMLVTKDVISSLTEGSQTQEGGSFTAEPSLVPISSPTPAPLNIEELEAVPTTYWNN